MGVIDKFLDFMRLNDDDYEFDNDEYDYDDDFEEPEEKVKKKPVQKEREKRKEEPVRTETFETNEKRQKPQQSKITPISKSRRQGQQGMEVCVIKPSSLEDEREITDTLLNGTTVVINMEGLSVDLAQRIIDFISGATFAIHGNLQKISSYIFLATPSGVDISGDIQNVLESFDIPGFQS